MFFEDLILLLFLHLVKGFNVDFGDGVAVHFVMITVFQISFKVLLVAIWIPDKVGGKAYDN